MISKRFHPPLFPSEEKSPLCCNHNVLWISWWCSVRFLSHRKTFFQMAYGDSCQAVWSLSSSPSENFRPYGEYEMQTSSVERRRQPAFIGISRSPECALLSPKHLRWTSKRKPYKVIISLSVLLFFVVVFFVSRRRLQEMPITIITLSTALDAIKFSWKILNHHFLIFLIFLNKFRTYQLSDNPIPSRHSVNWQSSCAVISKLDCGILTCQNRILLLTENGKMLLAFFFLYCLVFYRLHPKLKGKTHTHTDYPNWINEFLWFKPPCFFSGVVHLGVQL